MAGKRTPTIATNPVLDIALASKLSARGDAPRRWKASWVGPRSKSGSHKFQSHFIGDNGAGWSDWTGEYELP